MPRKEVLECDRPRCTDQGTEYTIIADNGTPREVIVCTPHLAEPMRDVLSWSRPSAGRRRPIVAKATGTGRERLLQIKQD